MLLGLEIWEIFLIRDRNCHSTDCEFGVIVLSGSVCLRAFKCIWSESVQGCQCIQVFVLENRQQDALA